MLQVSKANSPGLLPLGLLSPGLLFSLMASTSSLAPTQPCLSLELLSHWNCSLTGLLSHWTVLSLDLLSHWTCSPTELALPLDLLSHWTCFSHWTCLTLDLYLGLPLTRPTSRWSLGGCGFPISFSQEELLVAASLCPPRTYIKFLYRCLCVTHDYLSILLVPARIDCKAAVFVMLLYLSLLSP
jgi:hypothetical protein